MFYRAGDSPLVVANLWDANVARGAVEEEAGGVKVGEGLDLQHLLAHVGHLTHGDCRGHQHMQVDAGGQQRRQDTLQSTLILYTGQGDVSVCVCLRTKGRFAWSQPYIPCFEDPLHCPG